MPKHFSQIIIGAGIAGLSYAYRCQDDFLLVETQEELGGSWQSYSYKDSIYEFGPNSFMNRCDELEEMIDACGMRDQVISHPFSKSKRYLYQASKLKPVSPSSLIFSDLLSFETKLSIISELWRRNQATSEDESIYEFFSRRFSPELAEFVGHALKGIWAGDVRKLSASATLTKLKEAEAKHGSILWGLIKQKQEPRTENPKPKSKLQTCSFANGMSSFCEALGNYIGREKIITNAQSKILSYDGEFYHLEINSQKYTCKNLVFACKAYQAANLLAGTNPKLAQSLNLINYADIELSALSIKKNLLRQNSWKVFNAFGFINAEPQLNTLGVIFSSQVFPERQLKDEFLFTSFSRQASSPLNPQHELKELLQTYAATKLVSKNLELINQIKLSRAIPQYNIGYQKIIEQIEQELPTNIKLLGNYIGGVSLKDTICRSFEQADQASHTSAQATARI